MRCTDRRPNPLLSVAVLVALGAVATASSARPAVEAAEQPGPAASAIRLAAPQRMNSMNEVRAQAALRLVEANPDGTYLDTPPEVLLAIPVLDVELNGNGSIRRIRVVRYPGQAPGTTRLAMEALHRAAPFGEVSHLPKPWKFTEVFLFRDDRRFKPRTLDQ